MARILADDEDLAMASDDLALVAHLLDRRTYLHITFLSVCGSFYTYTPSRWRLFSQLCQPRRIRVFAAGRLPQKRGGLLEAVGDATTIEVVDGKLHSDAVSRQDFDVVHTHLAGNVSENGVTVL